MDSFQTRNELHWPRRIFHVMGGLLIVYVASKIETKRMMVIIMGSITSAVVFFELLRLTMPRINQKVMQIMGPLMRAPEESQLSGSAHFCIGATLSMLVFPREIALLSILFLAIGDPVASIVGVRYGKRFLTKDQGQLRKSIEGSSACFLVCAVVTFFMSRNMESHSWVSTLDLISFSILGGLGAAIGEILPLQTDDNLALPLISGAFLWLTSALFGLMPGLYF